MAVSFRQLTENMRQEEASRSRLLGGDGRAVRGRRGDPAYLADLAEAVKLVADVYDGKKRMHHLSEAMTTSDFPNLFGDIIDRQLLGVYQECPYTWNQWARRATVPDFRTVNRFAVNGAEGVLLAVGQEEEYPESKITDAKYNYAVAKYGRIVAFAFEAMQNDDLDALKDIPARFGKAARRSEEKFATGLHVLSSGPDTTFYSVANKNLVSIANGASVANPSLSVSGLQDAMIVLSKMVDADGEPITIESWTLVVPPALEVTAQNMLNATEVWFTDRSGSSSEQVHTSNWMKSKVKLAVNYYLPVVNTSSSAGTAWYVFADPNAGRPALEMGFLRGHETPEVFMKVPNASRIGGGVNPMDGDFDTDSIEYKVRHIFGGVQMDPKMSVASTGLNV